MLELRLRLPSWIKDWSNFQKQLWWCTHPEFQQRLPHAALQAILKSFPKEQIHSPKLGHVLLQMPRWNQAQIWFHKAPRYLLLTQIHSMQLHSQWPLKKLENLRILLKIKSYRKDLQRKVQCKLVNSNKRFTQLWFWNNFTFESKLQKNIRYHSSERHSSRKSQENRTFFKSSWSLQWAIRLFSLGSRPAMLEFFSLYFDQFKWECW